VTGIAPALGLEAPSSPLGSRISVSPYRSLAGQVDFPPNFVRTKGSRESILQPARPNFPGAREVRPQLL